MNRRTPLLALACLAPVIAFACDWGEDGVARLHELNPPPDGSTAEASVVASDAGCALPDDPDAGAAAAPSTSCLGLISGQWAVRLVQFDSIAPLGPPAWNLTITDLFLAHPSSDATSLELTFCDEETALTNSMGQPQTLGQNTTPPLLVSTLAATPLGVPLPGDGTIEASGVVWLWGLQGLANPATDPLPTSSDAGVVWDQDMDGNPGVTLDVVSPQGEIYLVKRAVFDFAQARASGGWFTGALKATVDQNALGASTPVLDMTVPITPRSGCSSLYQVKCVDPTLTCSSLVSGYQTLFVGAPNP